MITRILVVLVICSFSLAALADGRDIKASRSCSKSETEHAIAVLERPNNPQNIEERNAQISVLYACYGAKFVLEERLAGAAGSVVNYKIEPLNLLVTHSKDFVSISKAAN